jgi:hypothetical protein
MGVSRKIQEYGIAWKVWPINLGIGWVITGPNNHKRPNTGSEAVENVIKWIVKECEGMLC